MINALENVAMPPRIAALPRNKVGYPIPWFVARQEDGTRDFRVAGLPEQRAAMLAGLCWICGQALGAYKAFPIGPMCIINRLSAEPPSHRDCALYSAMVCPFLTNPAMVRREQHLPADTVDPGGAMITRNPGVTCVWITKTFNILRDPDDRLLWKIGEPTELFWLREGRPATREEVTASITSGLTTLEESCDRDPDPELSRRMLAQEVAEAMGLVPA